MCARARVVQTEATPSLHRRGRGEEGKKGLGGAGKSRADSAWLCVYCVVVCVALCCVVFVCFVVGVLLCLFVCVCFFKGLKKRGCCVICNVSLPEWSKGLRSGRNVFERVGSNPTADIFAVKASD